MFTVMHCMFSLSMFVRQSRDSVKKLAILMEKNKASLLFFSKIKIN